MNTINMKGNRFPAIEAKNLEGGMIYWDGSEIEQVVISGKTVRFVLNGNVQRTVRASSLIALSDKQIAVVL